MSAPPGCESLGRQCQALDVLLRIGSLEEGVDLPGPRGHLAPRPHRAHHLRRGLDRRRRAVRRCRAACTLSAPERLCRRAVPLRGARVRGPDAAAPEGGRPAEAARAGPFPGGGPDEAGQPPLPAPAYGRFPSSRSPSAQSLRGRPLPRPPTTSGERHAAGTCRWRSCAPGRSCYLEALIRHRKSPYLCKVGREGDFSIDVEMISACGFIEAGGVACTLHGRNRADGRTAKPDLCFEWPPKDKGLHPGCVFKGRRKAKKAG